MAIRRTLKDKKKAVERRENLTYQWQKIDEQALDDLKTPSISEQKSALKEPSEMARNILGYSLSLIYKDILKTIIFTLLLTSILVALFIWWK